ncbi:bifunctional 2-polyprenyl-6-hydroxyphenol methylase/3-demethylubiquinol 3-O-methyltransferase UbiG [Paludibacterium sp. B53371]|nr:class I SAM-dependent methyltransferase [Paludibacterium sp. B53371]BEV70878.1 class I SAM-dependent methyltransferase [Paludibacterium sp. THUN1379]
MEVEHYTSATLARFYDAFNESEHDWLFYQSQLGETSLDVLDVGCGTGSWPLRLAAGGHRVMAIDPAEAMVQCARAKDAGQTVQWHVGELSFVPPEPMFDLVTMTGHAFQCLQTDSDIAATLSGVRERLRPAGRLMFETRNPLRRAWRHWTPMVTRREVMLPDGQRLAHWNRFVEQIGQLIRFEDHYQLLPAGRHWVSESQLRFLSQPRLAEHLALAGFGKIDWYGDWQGGAFDPQSSGEIIVVAHAPAR